MTRSASSLDKLGQSVVTALESAAPERVRAIEEARRGFLQHEVGHRAQRSRAGRVRFRRLALAVAFAGTAAAAATFFVFPRGRTPLTFEVDGVQRSAKTWIAAAPERASVLSFSDGTRIRVEAAARARVVDIDAHGANLALESGSVHAEVAHRPDSAWKVVAGPFTVSDLGTVFDVHWDPNGELLGVTVVDGSVLVRESKHWHRAHSPCAGHFTPLGFGTVARKRACV
jgi:ferric-dicitrate binding protein FerR (iron transport regulator)